MNYEELSLKLKRTLRKYQFRGFQFLEFRYKRERLTAHFDLTAPIFFWRIARLIRADLVWANRA